MAFLRRFVEYLKTRLAVRSVVSENPTAFLQHVATSVAIDAKTLRCAGLGWRLPWTGCTSAGAALRWRRAAHLCSALRALTGLSRFCYDRLASLMKTLEIPNMDEFTPIQLVADFGTLIGTYEKGFAIIVEPYDARLPSVPDPVIQLACLDASLAMKPVFDKYQARPACA